MTPGVRVEVDENQQAVAAPRGREELGYIWVHNGSDALVYLSVWSGTATSRTAAQRVGPWPIPAGHTGPVPLEISARAGVVLAAHTADNLSGAPSAPVDVVPMWEG